MPVILSIIAVAAIAFLVFRLRQYFLGYLNAQGKYVSMPSQAAVLGPDKQTNEGFGDASFGGSDGVSDGGGSDGGGCGGGGD